METVRLQQITLATTCSLELAEHPLEGTMEPFETLKEHHQVDEVLEPLQEHPWDDLYIDNPVILCNSVPLREQNRFEKFSKSDEARAAKNLISVMAGFLICWLPYFIWLPTSTLMVPKYS